MLEERADFNVNSQSVSYPFQVWMFYFQLLSSAVFVGNSNNVANNDYY